LIRFIQFVDCVDAGARINSKANATPIVIVIAGCGVE
jgi:hypothetical protein